MTPVRLWVLLGFFLLASGLPIERRQTAVLDASQNQHSGVRISRALAGSFFELESSANIKVDSTNPNSLDFANAAADQFFAASSSANVVVVGSYRELVPTNNGVYFYIYWISRQPRQQMQVVFRKEQARLNPLDIRITFSPLLGLVLLDLWTCIGSTCSWASPSGTSWQMAQNIAYFSYNAETIVGADTHLVVSASAPAWFAGQQSDWARNGILAGQYAKGGIDLRQLPCYAQQQCADWDYIEILPPAPDVAAPPFPFQNGYCSHINILKSNEAGNANLSGAVFGLYLPFGDASQLQKGAKVGECTTDFRGRCSIRTDPGVKLLFEDIPPQGYRPVAAIIVNVVSTGQMISYPLRDKQSETTGLKIQKYSGADGSLVSGGSFQITQALRNGSTITWEIVNASATFCTDFPPNQMSLAKFVVDEKGCVSVRLVETYAPPGNIPVVLENVTFCISTDANKQECATRPTVRVRDMPTPTVTLTKVGTPGVSIAGAILGLSESGDPNQDYTLIPSYARCTIPTTGSSCKLRAPRLGRYWAVEIQPPLRYDRAAPVGPYDIVDGGSYAITIQDTLTCYGAPTIARLNCQGGSVDMTGAQYTVTSAGGGGGTGGGRTVQFNADAGYDRFCIANGTDIFALTQTEQGCCGDFTITETRPPNGQPPATQPTKQVYYCQARTPPDCGEKPIDVTFEAPPCYGSLVINKDAGAYGPLNGVVFQLTNSETGYSINQTVTGGMACWTELPPAIYYLREVATLPDYVLDTSTRVFDIEPSEDPNNCDNPTQSASITNLRKKGSFRINKVASHPYTGYVGTAPNSPLGGATFLIERVGLPAYSRTLVMTASGTECVTVDVGTYTVKETIPPTGYVLDPTVRTITVTESSTCTSLVYTWTDPETQPPTTTCAPTSPPAGCGVQISVTGTSYAGISSPLSGAYLSVRDGTGREVKSIFMTSASTCVNVPLGTYSIAQLATPGSGWVAVTSFPVQGECTSASSCPSSGSSQTIEYKAVS